MDETSGFMCEFAPFVTVSLRPKNCDPRTCLGSVFCCCLPASAAADLASAFAALQIKDASADFASGVAFFASSVLTPNLAAWLHNGEGAAAAATTVKAALEALDAFFAARTFVGGDAFTVADTVLAVALQPGFRFLFGELVATFPNVSRWFLTASNQPALKVTTPFTPSCCCVPSCGPARPSRCCASMY